MKISTLRLLSISYLLLPNLLFAVYWFRWEVSCLILAGYFYFSWLEIKGYISDNEKILFTLIDIIFIGIIALSWTLLTGTGGFFRQSNDFWGHNAKFYDLYKNDWPIYFKEVNTYACYYFSYYLVPSFFSKIIGFLSPALIILWTFAGFFAGLLWVYFFLNKNKYTTLSFVFIGATGHALKAIFTSIYPYTFYFREQNATEILPLFMQSYWAPNQVIPSVIGAGVLLYSAFWKKNIIDSLFPITLMFTWAIFPAIALGVVFVVLFMNQLLNGKSFEWGKISLFFLLWVPSAVYLLSSDGAPINNFIWIDRNFEGFITQYSADTLIDIVIFYLFIRHTKNNEKIIDLWFVNIILLITLLWSLYRIGLANDGFVRGQIPLITIIVVYVLRQIPQLLSVKKSIIATLLLAFLLLGASVSMRQIIQTFKESKISNILHNRTVYQPIPYDKYTNTYQMLFQHYSSSEANQYLGKKHSFYENYLSPQHK